MAHKYCDKGECCRTELINALKTVRDRLGIRQDFCPLGIALELEPVIRNALKVAGER